MNEMDVIRNLRYALLLPLTLICVAGFSQKLEEDPEPPRDWHHLDRLTDEYNGISTERAYSLLQDKPSRTIVVAVIDGGVDVDHEDLRDVIWVNEDEIPGNGKDDDNNGYVDDINGWSFIGDIREDTREITRIFADYHAKYGGKEETTIPKDEQEGYQYYLQIKEEMDKEIEDYRDDFLLYDNFYQMYRKSMRLVTAYLDLETDDVGLEEVGKIESTDAKITAARDLVKYAMQNQIGLKELEEYVENLDATLEYGFNPDFDPRPEVGDDFSDPYEKGYGNNNVKGFGTHGTMVAGLIGATRNNGIGIDGIADNVRIMGIRAVPEGDERDKDVANAIIYAVDNGADIINMSFGKYYSPRKEAVDKAIQYADSKGVLMIHAAGNENKNIDMSDHFPTKAYSNRKSASLWLEVGASAWGKEGNFVGTFSNYGKKSVDVFAPGVEVYTTSSHDAYETANGTSFASPVTAGVAALLMSYYPELSAKQIREIILDSSVRFDGLEVTKPSGPDDLPEQIAFEELSVTGGIVNAYEAVKMAESLSVGGRN